MIVAAVERSCTSFYPNGEACCPSLSSTCYKENDLPVRECCATVASPCTLVCRATLWEVERQPQAGDQTGGLFRERDGRHLEALQVQDDMVG